MIWFATHYPEWFAALSVGAIALGVWLADRFGGDHGAEG